MAVGETSGQGRPRRLITAGGGRRRAGLGAPGSGTAEELAAEELTAEELAAEELAAEELAAEEVALEELAAEEEVLADGAEASGTDRSASDTGRPDLEPSPDAARAGEVPEEESEAARAVSDLIAPPSEPDELERRLAEDEEMERRSRHEHHEAPHFRREVD